SLGLAGRNLLLVRRVPSVFIPSLVMPLFILIATAGAFHGIGALPQFAGESYLAFTIPMAAVMGAGFAGINSGMTLARDLEGGFFDRLQSSPAPRLALVLGPMLAAQARSLLTTLVVLIAGMAGGVMPPGITPTLVIFAFALLFAAAASFWAIGVALRTRTIQAAPIMQLAVFLSVFMSVAYVPQDALTGWLATIARYNPVTYILDAARSAELTGTVIWSETWPGVIAAGALVVLLGAFALVPLRGLGSR
ncbi:MAG: ABC transporter permease, partial [Miltoncostaeaceae bacterium]